MAKSKKVVVEEVAVEVVESTVVLNLPNEEPVYPGCVSRNFSKGKVFSEITSEEAPNAEEPVIE